MPNTNPTSARPITIGIVGGIASGKSFICQQFAARGGEIIDADRLGHEVLQLPEVKRELVSSFGQTILDSAGHVDRSKLSHLVFDKTDVADVNRKVLEQIVHPQIRKLAEWRIFQFQRRQTPPTAIIIDAPLLLEAKWDQFCDAVIFVDVPENVRVKRAVARGWSAAHFADRERTQMPLAEKRARSNYVIDNSPGADIAGQIDVIWNALVNTNQ